MEFRDRVLEALQMRGMTQADLCHKTQMGSSKVSQILSGKVKDPRLSTAIKIADALDVSLDYLAGRKESKAVRMSRDESTLLDNYRTAPPSGKASIERIARLEASSHEQEARGSSSEEASA